MRWRHAAPPTGSLARYGYEHRGRLVVTSLVHDVGRLALVLAYPGYSPSAQQHTVAPDRRIRDERRELGVDHAMVGGVLLRRWALPRSVVAAVERHHDPDADREPAILRLADMLAHYERDACVDRGAMLDAARALGFGREDLRRIVHELSSVPSADRRPLEACPLSRRELTVLQRLAQGGVNSQIAHDLQLSASTIRSHLHNVYKRLGVANRAQAVLLATERGWLQ